MKKIPKNITLYTASYPFANGEDFLEPELPFSMEYFDGVILAPFKSNGIKRNISEGVEVEQNLNVFSNSALSLSDHFLMLRILLIDLFVSGDSFSLKIFKTKFSVLKRATVISREIEKRFDVKDFLHYSFWMNDWALALMVLKYRRKDVSYVFRMLGYEVWEDRWPNRVVPFRKLMIKKALGVFPNSTISTQHLKDLGIKGNIVTQWLGNEDHGMASLPKSDQVISIFSCSALIPLKRVELIAEVLIHLGRKVNWVHVGSGPCSSAVSELVNKSEGLVFFNRIDRVEDLSAFFLNNSFHLFIHLSSTEGLPVVVQEAVSFGIPVLATDAGGTRDVVTPRSGQLIPVDFSIETAVSNLEELLSPKWQTEEARRGIRQFWLENFWAGKVYPDFYSRLKEMLS